MSRSGARWIRRAGEERLGRKADRVIEQGFYWLLRRRILKEARPL